MGVGSLCTAFHAVVITRFELVRQQPGPDSWNGDGAVVVVGKWVGDRVGVVGEAVGFCVTGDSVGGCVVGANVGGGLGQQYVVIDTITPVLHPLFVPACV